MPHQSKYGFQHYLAARARVAQEAEDRARPIKEAALAADPSVRAVVNDYLINGLGYLPTVEWGGGLDEEYSGLDLSCVYWRAKATLPIPSEGRARYDDRPSAIEMRIELRQSPDGLELVVGRPDGIDHQLDHLRKVLGGQTSLYVR